MPKKKSPKKQKPTPEYDSHHRQNVILEGMSNDIKAIAEGHSGLNQKIDKMSSELNQKVDKVASELTYVKRAVLDVGDKVDKLEKKLDTVTSDHEKRIQKLETVR